MKDRAIMFAAVCFGIYCLTMTGLSIEEFWSLKEFERLYYD
jgi:hypothetical protein